jgi:hypothetical protein
MNEVNVIMARYPTCFRLAVLLLAVVGSAHAQGPAPAPRIPETRVKELVVSPATAPNPALRYRLLPLESERKPGDAAPIYLRLLTQMGDDRIRPIRANHTAWIEKPTGAFPVAEARTFVDSWHSRLEQLDFGARRRTCDWNYTLPEQKEHAVEILLPDAQGMRDWSRLLIIKATLEINEHKYNDAIRTLETGISFGRHVADGPFVVNDLIGIAIVTEMTDRLELLITQPDAPNLYWALAALPRPLVNLRVGMETEQKIVEYMFPELTELDRTLTDAEWSSLLSRLHQRLLNLGNRIGKGGTPEKKGPGELTFAKYKADLIAAVSFAKFRTEHLPKAREYLGNRPGQISDDHAILLYIAGTYADLRDDVFKTLYLPYSEDTTTWDMAEKRLEAARASSWTFYVLADLMGLPRMGQLAEVRLDSRIAALRVVEAVRMHAAAHGGALPATLDDVKLVPIPHDPVTGVPFEYHRDGAAALLSGGRPGSPPLAISYRITVRN